MAEYIEREAAIKCAEKSYKMWNLTMAAAEGAREINKCYKMQEILKAIGETFKIVPAADVAPVVHGKWKATGTFKVADYNYTVVEQRCSACGHCSIRFKNKAESNYCPKCGAKMDGEETHDR